MLQGTDAAELVSPLTTLVRGVIEWVFPSSSWDDLHSQTTTGCQTRKLTIASLAELMVQVVAGARRSVFAAFTADQALPTPAIEATFQAVYGRLGRLSPEFSCRLVSVSAEQCGSLLKAADRQHLDGWEEFRIRIIDGTQPDGSEHRLKVLRGIRAAGLPCRFVVQFDPTSELCLEATCSRDAYASEQHLAEAMYERAKPGDLFVADRHFATTKAFLKLQQRGAYLLVREHLPQLILNPQGKLRKVGRCETGVVWEQPVELTDKQSGETIRVRRIVIKLDNPTEKGDTEIRLLTYLPKRIGALKIARLYRQRWTIETHFDFLKNHLQGQIESLGKPAAAIFALCMSMVAANALAVVKAAVRITHGPEKFDKLSGYYLADEIAGNYRAVRVLMTQTELDGLVTKKPKAFWNWCLSVAAQIRVDAFYSHPRGPKRPRPKRASGKHRHHYSTQRLLAGGETG